MSQGRINRNYNIDGILAKGTLLEDRYLIDAVLGYGGFGVTYLAFDRILSQKVAVKELRNDMFGSTNDNARGEKPIFPLDKFDIPGICCIKDYFENETAVYIVEEYMPGGTLKEYLNKNGPIEADLCCSLFSPVFEGLAQIHAMGIVHLDISPDNLMFASDGQIKLIDFGAARYIVTENEAMQLKESYAPPEQYMGEEYIGPWSDVFSLCGTIYYALTCHKPMPTMQRVKTDKIKKVSNLAKVPGYVSDTVMQGLSLNIQDRFFYTGNLADNLMLDTTSIEPLLGKIRDVWGQRFVTLISEGKGSFLKKKGHALKLTPKQNLVITGMIALLVTGFAVKKNSDNNTNALIGESVSSLSRFVSAATNESNCQNIEEGSPEYTEIIHALESFDFIVEKENGAEHYELPQNMVKELDLVSNSQPLFSLDKESICQVISDFFAIKLNRTSSNYYGNASVYHSTKNYISLVFYNEDEYTFQRHGKELCFSVNYDTASERVRSIRIDVDQKDFSLIMKELIPYLVPEFDLNDVEIDALYQKLASDEYYTVSRYSKLNISAQEHMDHEDMLILFIDAGYIL